MENKGNRRGSKLFLLFFVVLFTYLAFFNFDFSAAYHYAIDGSRDWLGL